MIAISFFPYLSIILYLGLIFGSIYMVFKWVNKFISLKQEQNDLLRDIVKKMDAK
ncbi:hypothetical protein SAMN04487911_1313 [Arenibacter nanhaiticus]|uniref:Uncharacterized protein n=1 Tax=Arenibacter nanhaiticus TaxID=558155 RepID=A0A1M6LDR0_9FLAO|nr:hypothetical protein [Arenibacter nanhaiticus]SHJ69359.1 hypothetical protein SAMN04487911_1313 [Arenibacter nanhaiticus]